MQRTIPSERAGNSAPLCRAAGQFANFELSHTVSAVRYLPSPGSFRPSTGSSSSRTTILSCLAVLVRPALAAVAPSHSYATSSTGSSESSPDLARLTGRLGAEAGCARLYLHRPQRSSAPPLPLAASRSSPRLAGHALPLRPAGRPAQVASVVYLALPGALGL